MPLAASPEAYRKVIEYGLKKTQLRVDRLFLQAIMAGVYVGMAGHACTVLAGGYTTDPSDPLAISKSSQKLLYASIFPTAFIAIIFTGAELFTGNTMTMLICVLERRVTFLQLLVNWTCSLVGNWAGALFAAYFLSYMTGALTVDPYKHYLEHVTEAKTSYSFGECFFRAVGCNTFVCLAVWFVTASDDAAGKIMAMWFPIVAFCVAGYEHIIANFYTLQCALLHGVKQSVGEVVVKNFIPTLIGNLVGGCGLVGAVYWYNFYPTVCYIQESAPHAQTVVEEPKASERKRDHLFNTGAVHTSLLGRLPPAASGAVTRAVTPQSAATAGSAAGAPVVGSSDTMAAPGASAGDSPRVACLAPPVLSKNQLPSSAELVVLPRHSFGGECAYRPAASPGVVRHPIGSGGGFLCRVPSRVAPEGPTASGQESATLVPVEKSTGTAPTRSDAPPLLRPAVSSKSTSAVPVSGGNAAGEVLSRYGGASPAISVSPTGDLLGKLCAIFCVDAGVARWQLSMDAAPVDTDSRVASPEYMDTAGLCFKGGSSYNLGVKKRASWVFTSPYLHYITGTRPDSPCASSARSHAPSCGRVYVQLKDRAEEDQQSLPSFQFSVIPPDAVPHVPNHSDDPEEKDFPERLLQPSSALSLPFVDSQQPEAAGETDGHQSTGVQEPPV